jgi:hypothetical protein
MEFTAMKMRILNIHTEFQKEGSTNLEAVKGFT